MKMHFNPDLDFQHDVFASIVRLFKWQEIRQSHFIEPAIYIMVYLPRLIKQDF